MRRASKILSIIGGIFVLLSLLYILGTIGLMFLGSGTLGILGVVNLAMAFIQTGDSGIVFTFQNITNDPSILVPTVVFFVIAFLLFVFAIVAVAEAIICLVNGILVLKGSGKKAKKSSHIAGIVFDVLYLLFFGSMFAGVGIIGAIVGFLGILIDFLLVLLGHIFGLIALKKEKQQEEKVVSIQ